MFLPRRLSMIVQYFISVVGKQRVHMLSDGWFYVCGYCCSPVFKKENSPLDQRMVHTQKSHDLGLIERNTAIFFFFAVGWPIFYECRNLHHIIARSNTYEKKTHSEVIHYARRFGHWECFQRPEIHRCFVSFNWIYCLKTCFLLQTEDNEYCAMLFIDCSVFSCSLHSITTRGSTILCSIHYCTIFFTN